MPHIESLTKALHSAQFALSDLIAASKTATPPVLTYGGES